MKRNAKISSFFIKKTKVSESESIEKPKSSQDQEYVEDTADEPNPQPNDTDTELGNTLLRMSDDSTTESEVENDDIEIMDDEIDYPSYWPQNAWQQKMKQNPWLKISKSHLGCKVCMKVGTLGANTSVGLKISKEWTKCQVTCYGDTEKKKRQSIRKKIFEHANSFAHKKCVAVSEKSKGNDLQNSLFIQQHKNSQTTCRIFRTVYALVKANRPFSDLPWLSDLQEQNGLSMGTILQSDHSCSQIAEHIATEMRFNIIAKIKQNNCKIGLMIDESTTVSKKTALSICIRMVLPNCTEANSVFLVFVELAETTATTIVETLLQTLDKNGLDDEYLKTHLVSFATDGASNMLGRKNGVARLISQKYPNVILWHCSNHRLELAVHDVVTEMNEVILHLRNIYFYFFVLLPYTYDM